MAKLVIPWCLDENGWQHENLTNKEHAGCQPQRIYRRPLLQQHSTERITQGSDERNRFTKWRSPETENARRPQDNDELHDPIARPASLRSVIRSSAMRK